MKRPTKAKRWCTRRSTRHLTTTPHDGASRLTVAQEMARQDLSRIGYKLELAADMLTEIVESLARIHDMVGEDQP